MLLDCLKQAEVGQRMLLAWVNFLALPTPPPPSSLSRNEGSIRLLEAERIPQMGYLCTNI
jgi:hypothetical protein